MESAGEKPFRPCPGIVEGGRLGLSLQGGDDRYRSGEKDRQLGA